MHAPARSKYKCEALTESIKGSSADTTQEDDEGPIDCANHCKQARKTFEAMFVNFRCQQYERSYITYLSFMVSPYANISC